MFAIFVYFCQPIREVVCGGGALGGNVAGRDDVLTAWLPVIGKSLAYLCMQTARGTDASKLDSVLKRVAFLEGLGLSRDDAANAAGSSSDSVRVLQRRSGTRKAKNGKAKKKRTV
jgi:hypothetical protein